MDDNVRKHQDQLRTNLLSSFGFQNGKEEVDESLSDRKLEKGILSYQLTSSSTFTISKSGKLIKEKLEAIKTLATQRLTECQSIVQTLKSQISEEPTQETDTYDTIMNLRIQPLPKTFTWDQINPEKSEGSRINSYLPEPSNSEANDSVKDLMRKYNDSVYQLTSFKKDIVMIDTMLNNFQDNKTYDLSVEQAAIFGF